MKKILIPLFLFLFFALSFFVSGNIDSQDGQLYLAVARYIYYTGEPTAPPYEYKFDGTGQNIHMGTYLGQDGKTYSPTGLGYTFALLPAVFVTNLVYKLYQTPVQLEHFPLQSDWLILFTASFTNAFFGALLGIIIFLYLLELRLNKIQALIITLTTIFATNLWPYTKHSFAHMMFISFLVLSFFFIRKYFNYAKNERALSNRKKYLFYSGVSFGVCALTYNQSFTLSIIPLVAYYFLLSKSELTKSFFKKALKDFAIFFIAFIPFFLVFVLFELLRFRVWTALANEDFIRQYKIFFSVPVSVFIEGIYGQLLSPGRSIFIYSPVLLLLILFWEKLKNVKAELVAFLILSITYIFFFASLYVIEEPEYGARGLWDGELSWGPRYLLPLILLQLC